MVSKPLEDLWPFLPRDEFLSQHDHSAGRGVKCAILIAGLGAIGQRHARNLRAICWRRSGAARVPPAAAAARRHRDARARRLAQRRDASSAVTRLRRSRRGARRRGRTRCSCARRRAGTSRSRSAPATPGCHLFIEKPVSHTLDGVESLAGDGRGEALVALVGCQWRYHPARAVAARGAAGEARSGRSFARRSTTPSTFRTGIHTRTTARPMRRARSLVAASC